MRLRAVLGAAFGLGALTGMAAPVAAEAAGRIAYLASTGAYWQVWVIDATGSEPRQVTRSTYEKARLSWFPDGETLLVSALDGRAFRVEVDSGEEKEIPIPLDGATDAVVSPDGQHIAFSLSTADSVDANDIWIITVGGEGLRRLTSMVNLQHDPQWSSDGRYLYFLSGDGGQSHDIWRIALSGGAQEQLTAGGLYHFDLALSPQGLLAFSSNRSGNYEVYVQEGLSPARRLTVHSALDGGPTWSPDGRELVFHSTRGGSLNLWRVPLEGGDARQLTFHESGARDAVWDGAR
jgi:TolB protein